MASPLLDRPGAVEAEGVDAGVAWHYGDPLREQRRLMTGEGFVDLSHHGVVTVTGPDRLSWLHSLTSQHLTSLAPATWTQALVLSPHGHVEHHLRLVDDGSTTWCVVEPGTAPALVGWLDSMRFLLRVEVADETARWAVVARVDGLELVERDRLVAWASSAGPAAGVWAHEALRVAAHQPRLGFETDHRTIPHEVGWIGSAVHLDKGCYRGQETVARVENLGRPPRRLVFLHLDGSDEVLPAHGDPVTHEDRQIGFVGTAVVHAELGPVALALVKRATPLDAPLVAGEVAAAQEVVVQP